MAILIKERQIASQSAQSPKEADVIRLEPNADLAAVASKLAHAARVEINFPKFGDGRGYSLARLLRERYGYTGELRAVGQVARDLLLYMESCGFDSYELRDGEEGEEALGAFHDFSDLYQASVTRPVPLFRRR